MVKILLTGIAVLDVVNEVDGYPAEDDEVRAVDRYQYLGGNAANTARVLSQFDLEVTWLGTMASDAQGLWLQSELTNAGVEVLAQRVNGHTPTSYITVNRQTGSRTIIHYRDLRELSVGDFAAVTDGRCFDWVHFEGRNINRLQQILPLLRERLPSVTISLEVEKPRPGIESLFPLVNVLFFSRPFAVLQGFTDAASFLNQWAASWPHAVCVCTWGDAGAWAMASSVQDSSAGSLAARLYQVPAYMPPRVVDTLGAGDTFNAGFIAAMATGQGVQQSLYSANRLAGIKCGQRGLSGLADVAASLEAAGVSE